MFKSCSKCGTDKPVAEMRRQKGSPDGLSSWCLTCHREGNRISSLARFQRNRVLLAQKKSNPCMDCGRQFDPCCMDFDHVRGPKFKGVGQMVTYSEQRLLAEIQKCDLVCAVCHRKRTQSRNVAVNPRYASFAGKLETLKRAPCLDCGDAFDPCCMDFDHVRGSKSLSIARMYTTAWDKVLAEIAKCDLVCANCHRIRTNQRRQEAA